MQEVGAFLRQPAAGRKVKDALSYFPQLEVTSQAFPITDAMLRISLTISPRFRWRDQAHGQTMRWILLVEDSERDTVYHNDTWILTRKMMQACRFCSFAAFPAT
jgi:activating signal cointegrator complex subunit 3